MTGERDVDEVATSVNTRSPRVQVTTCPDRVISTLALYGPRSNVREFCTVRSSGCNDRPYRWKTSSATLGRVVITRNITQAFVSGNLQTEL